jgi:hypothetical protein
MDFAGAGEFFHENMMFHQRVKMPKFLLPEGEEQDSSGHRPGVRMVPPTIDALKGHYNWNDAMLCYALSGRHWIIAAFSQGVALGCLVFGLSGRRSSRI